MRTIVTWTLWWVALFWLWLVYQGEWNRIEWVAAACSATLAATLATVLAGRRLPRFGVPPHVVVAVARVPLQIVIDFGIVSFALGRRLLGAPVRGTFIVRRSSSGADGTRAAGERAWRAVLATYSPNAYVVDVDPDSHDALVHDLVPHRPSESPV